MSVLQELKQHFPNFSKKNKWVPLVFLQEMKKIKNKKFEKSDLSSGTVIVLTQLHWAKH